MPIAAEARPVVEGDVPPPPPSSEQGSSLLEWLLVALVVVLLGGSLWLRRRKPQSAVVDDGRAEPLAALRTQLAGDGRDAEAHFHTYLARALDTTGAAVIGPDFETRLRQRGVASDLARRVARHVEATVGARYGGAPAPQLDVKMVEELERGFKQRLR